MTTTTLKQEFWMQSHNKCVLELYKLNGNVFMTTYREKYDVHTEYIV